jgi:hypothetical protein
LLVSIAERGLQEHEVQRARNLLDEHHRYLHQQLLIEPENSTWRRLDEKG